MVTYLLCMQKVFLPLVGCSASLVSACHVIGMSHMDGLAGGLRCVAFGLDVYRRL